MNILITSAGQRVSLVRAFQAELKKSIPSAKVFTVDMRPELSSACHASDGFFQVRRVTDPEYIPELLALCQRLDIKMVVPTIDTELLVLAEHKGRFLQEGIDLIVSSLQFVQLCRDKRKTNTFFEEKNIPVPKAISKTDPTFPLFIKPFDGSLSADIFIIRNKEQLTEDLVTNDRFLFMEYLDRNQFDEYTVDMYYGKDHELKCIVPRKRLLVRAGEVNKALTCKNKLVNFLQERLFKIDGAVGCLTTQLFMSHDSEKIYGIEINPRFGGGYPLSYRAGANFPGWLINEYFYAKQLSYTDQWENNMLMLRYDDEIIVHDYSSFS